MATTNSCQIALTTLIKAWFAGANAKYSVPIDAANILGYSTTPGDSSASPHWVIVRVLATRPDSEVFEHTDLPVRMTITLFSGMTQTESSREAAERWINDAEEMLVEQLARAEQTANWKEIAIVGNPRRDVHKRYHGSHRTSDIAIEIEKINTN